MTHGWVIAVPAWGEHHRRLFLGPALRSHMAAIARLKRDYRDSMRVRYVVQTDDPVAVARALAGFEVTLVPPPPPDAPYLAFVAAHRHGLDNARLGERVCITNADMVMSVEALSACEARFRQGKRAIIAASTRTVAPTMRRLPSNLNPFALGWDNLRGVVGPEPMTSRDLLAYTMRRPHKVIRACFWGTGRCHLPWGVYFRQGDNIVLRGFHLHPFAVVKDRDLSFQNTVDLAMVDHFSREEMHVVTNADEMALAEMSGPDKTFDDNDWAIDTTAVLSWALRGAGPTHWWNFTHRICVQGDPDEVTSDADVAAGVDRLNPWERREVAA